VTGYLSRSRHAALCVIAAAVGIASLVSFAESFRALYLWAHGHQVPGIFAGTWPLMIDTFLAVGELALFVALVDGWSWRARTLPWGAVAGGLAASIAANVGHATGHDWTVRATAAIPPLAAVAALGIGLGIVKRVAGRVDQPPAGHEPDSEQFTPDALAQMAGHRAELDASPSDAARIRYAMQVTGSRGAREIADWLEAHGHRVATDNARSVVARTNRTNANVARLPQVRNDRAG
jgi:hypothetical protein